MSIQLIVYPQSYNGYFNAISSSPTEFTANGINFNDVDNSGTYTSTAANPYLDTVTNAPPSIVNTWNRFRKGSIAFPTNVAGDLVLVGGSSEISGIYQEISNLTIGAQYTITINTSVAVVGGFVGVRVYSGANLQGSSTTYSSNVTQISKTFFAAATELTIMVSYYNAASSNLTISNISTQPVVGAIPSGSFELDDGQAICDLYEDEDLPLTLSVDDFKNVAEQVQSYSKAFNLPATKRNNKIFDNIFEITRSNDGIIFNAYKKTQCVLKQDGFVLFEGYLRLLDVTDKEGEISYNVNLYSEVIALADVLKDREFRDLDFTELEHAYNLTNIQATWNPAAAGVTYTNPSTSGFRGSNTVKYPFVDWNHQVILGALGTTVLDSLETAFRPFINIKYLVDRIFNAPGTPFNFTSTFFNTADFKKLYMDFNWGSDNNPFTIDESGLGKPLVSQIASPAFATIESADNNFDTNIGYSSGVYMALLDNQTYTMDYSYLYITSIAAAAWNAEFRWKMVKGGITSYINITPISGVGISFGTSTGNFTQILNTGDTLTPEFKSATAATNTFSLEGMNSQLGTSATTVVTSATAVTNNIFLQTLRGELGQWDFLKGLMTMFNLVTLVDEDNPNNIIIEPYTNIFIPDATAGTTLANRGIEHDWTDKIDVSEMKLEPLADLNKNTIFKFVEDDDDYAFNQYKN